MYIQNKYTTWYYNIINKAKSENRVKSKEQYFESHHIIPKSFGGIEEVLLTAKEHFICHLLLCRMTTGSDKHKMINALIRMAFSKSKGQKRYTSRSFSVVRALIAEKNSEIFKGKPKSEETRKKMKGVNGKWKRTEEYKKQLSESRKGKFIGENNPFYGKKHSVESMNKRSTTRKAKGIIPKFTGKGSKWYTDGKEDKMLYSNQTVPEGFLPGRTKNRRKCLATSQQKSPT